MSDEESTGISEKTRELYEKMDSAIREYFESAWKDLGTAEAGDYIESWALVVNFGNINLNRPALNYSYETFPYRMSPHAIKGLFNEGNIVVEQNQYPDD